MSKIHSKIDTTKSISLAAIGISIVLIIVQTVIIITAIISSQQSPKTLSNPIEIQQQNIKKAYDLITSQTVTDNSQ